MGKVKSQKIAHIVPVECLEKTADNQYHMCLAHLVKQSDAYASFYRRMSDEGKFVLMDNGAAEGEQLSVPDLIKCYEMVRPSEVVLPDTLLDANDTLVKGAVALTSIRRYYGGEAPFTFMAVPQGPDLQSWIRCLDEMLEWPKINCIGVSKFLQMETGEKWIRRNAVNAIKCRLDHASIKSVTEVHLLGCSESTDVIRTIFEDFDIVRGCDSAFVYIASQAGVSLGTNAASRTSGEIDFLGGRDYSLLSANMESFNRQVGVVNNGVTDTSWFGMEE